MKKLVFIIPYFGRFNNYFQLFLNSCAKNVDIDWMIFTDDKRNFKYPKNVIVRYMSFDELKNIVQSYFDFKIKLEFPYKLCDYKPTYGLIFKQYIKEYQFWGYCDTDLIWGNINEFITNETMKNYDKIGIFGHCTIYRNTEYINNLFKKSLKGVEIYKKVYTSSQGYSFDEEFNNSINNIFEQENIKIYYIKALANIYTKSSDFRLTTMNMDKKTYSKEQLKKAFFVWNKGNLYRYINTNNIIKKEKYLYIHMQSRKMKINLKNIDCDKYKIIPNSFDDIEVLEEINKNNFNKIKIKHFNLHYFKLRIKNLYIKIKRRINGYYNS